MYPSLCPWPPTVSNWRTEFPVIQSVQAKVGVHILEMLASWSHRSCSTTWFWISTMGRLRGILRLFLLFLGTQCPMPDTWCLARKPVPLGKGVGHTVNKEHKKVPSVPPHTSAHTSPQWKNAGVWKQWEPMSHGGRQDNVSPKKLRLTMSRGADVHSWQTVTPGMTFSSGQSLALPWMT